eukprot:TRINITY_DN4104_c0_g1_i2.p1 TRINITY_DN4104_c0_g1~~TRINITY_DN4104_c0_g1_i2.p1  ORF type:complete len:980 (+),score=294.81 TRINITY_DN4104_c0_g1_i2:774-3713(+)
MKFEARKCTMILKLASNRLNIHKAKKTEVSLKHKKEVGELLASGKGDHARVMTRAVIQEDYTIETLSLVELYCSTIVSRIDAIDSSRKCPDDLQEPICSLIYSAPFLAQDAKFGEPELMRVRKMFLERYGKKFANECIEHKCINPRLLKNFSGKRAPSDSLINFYMQAISGKNQDLSPMTLLQVDVVEHPRDEDIVMPTLTSLSISESPPVEVAVAVPITSGMLIIDNSNNAWVIDDTKDVTPMYIPKEDLNGAGNADRVMAQQVPRPDGRLVGKILSVSSKADPPREIRGRLQVDASDNTYIEDLQASSKESLVYVAKSDLNGSEKDDLVKVQLFPRWKKDAPSSGKVLQVIEKAPKPFIASISIDEKGNAFLIDIEKKLNFKPISIESSQLGGALNGDLVVAHVSPPKSDGKTVAKVISITKRAQQPIELAARIRIDKQKHAWAMDPKEKTKPVFIPPNELGSATEGDLVFVRATPVQPNGTLVGKILSLLEKAPQPFEVTGIVEFDKQGNALVTAQRSNALTYGTIRSKSKVTALKPFEQTQQPIAIPAKDLNNAKEGDIVQILAYPPKDGKSVGKVLTIVAKAAFREKGPQKTASPTLRTLSEEAWNQAIILDNGSGTVKVGFANETSPKYVFPAVIGKPMYSSIQSQSGNTKNILYVGEEALSKRGLLRLNYPIEHGIVTNWEDVEALWSHTFRNVLKVSSKERPVMLTEAPLNPKANREKMQEIMFEKFEVPALYVAIQAVLTLYALNETTGFVLDSGDGVTHAVPIYEGFTVSHAISRFNLAGRDITDYLSVLLSERGIYQQTTFEKETVRDMKERLSYVAEDFGAEMKKDVKTLEKSYQLPDGQTIKIGNERFRCAEALFQPNMRGLDTGGIQHLTFQSIQSCDLDVRKDLYANIVLSGGTTCIEGFEKRFTSELASLSGAKVNLQMNPNKKFAVWQGGCVLAGLNSFRDHWITKQEYLEFGPNIIHRKCT